MKVCIGVVFVVDYNNTSSCMKETVDKCHRNRVPKKDASSSAAVIDLGWTSYIVFESHSTDVQPNQSAFAPILKCCMLS